MMTNQQANDVDVAAAREKRDTAERLMLAATANGHGMVTISKAHWKLHDADETLVAALEADRDRLQRTVDELAAQVARCEASMDDLLRTRKRLT